MSSSVLKLPKENLIVPVEIYLSEEDLLSLIEYKEDIESIGFGFTIDSKTKTVSISKIPSEIGTDGTEDTFCAMLSRLSDGKGTVESTESEFFGSVL